MRRRLVPFLLVSALVALLVLSYVVGSGRGDGGSFAGADATATARIEADHPDYEPWHEPLFSSSSGEVESGLFALQAALGGLVLGYVIGILRERRRRETAPQDPAP